jgi:hypothetical protein
MAELRVVIPPVSVRFRPATPERIAPTPLVAEMADATVLGTVAAWHARSTRAEGTNHAVKECIMKKQEKYVLFPFREDEQAP